MKSLLLNMSMMSISFARGKSLSDAVDQEQSLFDITSDWAASCLMVLSVEKCFVTHFPQSIKKTVQSYHQWQSKVCGCQDSWKSLNFWHYIYIFFRIGRYMRIVCAQNCQASVLQQFSCSLHTCKPLNFLAAAEQFE